MSLSTLYSYLQSALDAGSLKLDTSDSNLGADLQGFLAKAPNTSMTINVGSTGLNLAGDVLTISGTSSETWDLQGLHGKSVAMATVNLTLSGDSNTTISCAATGSTSISGQPASVAINSDSTDLGTWYLTTSQAVSGLSPIALMDYPDYGPLPIPLPDNVDIFGLSLSLAAGDFNIKYYPQTKAEAVFDFTLDAPQASWAIVPNIFELVGLTFKVTWLGSALSLTIEANLTIGSVGVTIGITANSTENWTAFITPTTGTTFPGLADFASLIGGSSMEGDLNTGMTDMAFGVSDFDAGISKVLLDFNWKTFALNNLEVIGVLDVKTYLLDATFSYPSLSIKAWLDPTTPVPVNSVFSSFGLDVSAFPQDLVISQMGLYAEVKKSSYGFSLVISDDKGWDIGPLSLESLTFQVDYADKEATGSIAASLAIAQVEITLEAGYGGATTGWYFKGGTLPDSEVKMGDLIADIGGKFGITVPTAIQSMVLKDINFSYETGTGNFHFGCECDLTVQEVPVRIIPKVDISNTGTKAAPVWEDLYSGTLDISTLEFELVFDKTKTDNTFLAAYSHTGDQTPFNIHDLVEGISPGLAKIIPSSLAVDLKDVIFAYYKVSTPTVATKWTIAMDLGLTFNLSDIPLVGSVLPADETVGFENLKIQYSNNAFTKEDASTLNKLISSQLTNVQPLPDNGFPSGMNATAKMKFGPLSEDLGLDMAGNASNAPQTIPSQTAPAKTSYTNGTWFNLQRGIGPIYFNKIGVDYSDGTLYFLMDASFTLGGMKLTLEEAGFGSPLDHFDLKFTLSGIGLEYSAPGLEIGGGLLIVKPPPANVEFQFDGDVVIKVGVFSIAAIGSYAQMTNGDPSLFVFADVQAPIGPEPIFFITGLSAGFGYNRDILIPAYDEVLDFPLIALSNSEPGMPTDMETVLAIMEGKQAGPSGHTHQWIQPRLGEYWMAFGLQFNSFELVFGNAMVVAKFGDEFELALIGVAKVRLPQVGPEVFAYAELMMEVDWKPDSGFFGLSAVLSKTSFVLDKNCHLTGGFAFFVWYGGEHSGQFVLTLGGYHPDFSPPDFYPAIPRLGINWVISDKIAITGDAYFALTPGSIMAGGGLSLSFHDGDLKAWFTAQANMLVTFNPFYFTVRISISVGVSYKMDLLFTTVTIKVDLGCSMDLWGPEIGGTVKVDFYIISFSIGFGAGQKGANNDPLGWDDFKPLLPSGKENTLGVNTGMTKQLADGTWVVRADEFAFSTNSVIPCRSLTYNGNAITTQDYDFDIRPMNKTSVNSVQNLVITKQGHSGIWDTSDWTLEPLIRNMADTLWGAPLEKDGSFILNPKTPSNGTISDAPIGISVKAPDPELGNSPGVLAIEVLESEPIEPDGTMPVSLSQSPITIFEGHAASGSVADVKTTMESAPKGNRDSIFSALQTANLFDGWNDSLSNLVTTADQQFSDSPMEV